MKILLILLSIFLFVGCSNDSTINTNVDTEKLSEDSIIASEITASEETTISTSKKLVQTSSSDYVNIDHILDFWESQYSERIFSDDTWLITGSNFKAAGEDATPLLIENKNALIGIIGTSFDGTSFFVDYYVENKTDKDAIFTVDFVKVDFHNVSEYTVLDGNEVKADSSRVVTVKTKKRDILEATSKSFDDFLLMNISVSIEYQKDEYPRDILASEDIDIPYNVFTRNSYFRG